MSQNRFLQLETTLQEKRSRHTGKERVSLARGTSDLPEIDAATLKQIIDGIGVINTPQQVIDLIIKLHDRFANAKIMGRTLRTVFASSAPAEFKNLLNSVECIEKTDKTVKIKLTQSSVRLNAAGQHITISNPVTSKITTIKSSEIIINVAGVSHTMAKINKVFIYTDKIMVKAGILPAFTVWQTKSGAQAIALNYIPELHTVLSLTLGEQIVKNYNESNDKQPEGDCFAVAKSRVMAAYQQVNGKSLYDDLPASPINGLSAKKLFDMLWNIWYWHNKWLQAPQQYRAKGSAGAVSWAGIASPVDHAQVISGGLKPGAVVQVWQTEQQFTHLRDNHNSLPAGAFGHSFIFLNYHYEQGNITGMFIADQGTGWDGASPMGINTWGHYSGANFN